MRSAHTPMLPHRTEGGRRHGRDSASPPSPGAGKQPCPSKLRTDAVAKCPRCLQLLACSSGVSPAGASGPLDASGMPPGRQPPRPLSVSRDSCLAPGRGTAATVAARWPRGGGTMSAELGCAGDITGGSAGGISGGLLGVSVGGLLGVSVGGLLGIPVCVTMQKKDTGGWLESLARNGGITMQTGSVNAVSVSCGQGTARASPRGGKASRPGSAWRHPEWTPLLAESWLSGADPCPRNAPHALAACRCMQNAPCRQRRPSGSLLAVPPASVDLLGLRWRGVLTVVTVLLRCSAAPSPLQILTRP